MKKSVIAFNYGTVAETTGAAAIEAYLYTNGVQAVTTSGNKIGWDRTISINAIGSIGCKKTLTLPAGCVLDWRLNTAAGTETLHWEHGTIWVERKR